MAILEAEIKYYLTGGGTNNLPAASFGGSISNVELVSAVLNNLFDDVTADEASAGDTEYRCIAVKNTNANTNWPNVKAFIANNTAGGDSIEIGIEVPVGGVVQTIANENSAPSGISFSAPSDRSGGLNITGQGDSTGTLGYGKWCAIWVKRVVPSSTAAQSNNSATLRVNGDGV